jgi:hypothetical protein
MPNGNGNGARLDSWKDIATYLRRDVRTAIRWEKEKGLPVRRVPGGQRKAVFAYTSELDAWLTHEELELQGLKPGSNEGLNGTVEAVPFPTATALAPQSGRQRWPYYVALVAAVVVIATVVIAFETRTHAGGASFPVRVAFSMNALRALDADGQILWSYPLPGTVDPEQVIDGRGLQDEVRIADFTGNGDREVLALLPMRVGPNATHSDRYEVDLFSSRGKLLWSYVPRGRLVFATHDFKDNWRVLDLFVSDHQGKKQIWIVVAHSVWGHSFIVSLDPATGKDSLRYVNSGSIFTLNELATTHGNFLLAAGFNNEYDSGSLAVIDESKDFAASPQTEGTSHKCLNCPKGDPAYYFVFPRSEINELVQFYEDRVYKMSVTEDEIEVRKEETEWSTGAQSLYLLKSDGLIRPVSVRFETSYDRLHNKFEREGKINHSLANCPERLQPRPVKMWTPEGGWTEVRLEAGLASK